MEDIGVMAPYRRQVRTKKVFWREELSLHYLEELSPYVPSTSMELLFFSSIPKLQPLH